MTRLRLGLCCILAALLGCERPPAPPDHPPAAAETALRDYPRRPRVDPNERDVPPLRILSLAPNLTEICAALGAAGQLVGRTRYCVYPPRATHAVSVGALIDLNIETVIGLHPDAVLLAGDSRQIADALARANLPLVRTPDRTLDDLFVAIRTIGARLGRPRTAERLADAIAADLDAVRRRYAELPQQRVLLLTGPLSAPPTPPFVAGPGSFYHELLQRAGQTNACPPDAPAFAPLALEALLDARPDVIIELDPDGRARPAGDASALAAWRALPQAPAVANERVHVLVGQQHFVLGPRIAHTFEALCEALAPDDHRP